MEAPYILIGQLASVFYFLGFLVLIPGVRAVEKAFCESF